MKPPGCLKPPMAHLQGRLDTKCKVIETLPCLVFSQGKHVMPCKPHFIEIEPVTPKTGASLVSK